MNVCFLWCSTVSIILISSGRTRSELIRSKVQRRRCEIYNDFTEHFPFHLVMHVVPPPACAMGRPIMIVSRQRMRQDQNDAINLRLRSGIKEHQTQPERLIYLPFHIPTTSRENVARFRPTQPGNVECSLSAARRDKVEGVIISRVPSEQALIWFINTNVNETPNWKHVRCSNVKSDRKGENVAKDTRREYQALSSHFTPLSEVSVDRFMKNWKVLHGSFAGLTDSIEDFIKNHFQIEKYIQLLPTTDP